MPEREIPNTLSIYTYVHCGLCIDEWKADPSINTTMPPRDYAQLEVGWTKAGLQVWCKRHECNVMHVDFDGAQHRANTTRKP
jgi:hypothetical protein